MATGLDMSLDDMIAKNRKSRGGTGPTRGSGSGSRPGPTRCNHPNRKSNRSAPYQSAKAPESTWEQDMFSERSEDLPPRSSRSSGGIETGTKLYILNLDYGVMNEDIKELFAEVGELKRYTVHFNRSGRSKGTAEVVFSRRGDALAAVKKYNDVQLDGKPMKIEIVGTNLETAAAPSCRPANANTNGASWSYLSDSLMGFFDLSLPYNEPPQSGGKEVAGGKTLRLKLATKAMELGYVGIAHNHSIKGVMSDKDCCTIPLLTLGSLIKVAPRLASSVGFHRDLIGVPRAAPFRQYTRLTVHVESNAQCQGLNSGNPILKSYDIIAVRPMNQNTFDHTCEKAEVDLISIDFTDKMSFRLKHPMVKAAIKRGIYFEIKYSDLLMDAQTRRQVISNTKLLVDWTRGKNLIISSGAPSVTELRGPNDVINLMSLLGLSTERARAAISKNCRNMIAKVLKKKRFHKEAVRVELLSSGDTFSLEQPLSDDCMKWDPLSSGEGDMLLDDLAKAFDATKAVAHKSSKAIDFTSVLDGLQTHGFRVKDIVGTESLTQPPAVQIIDVPVPSNNKVSELRMAVTASSEDNLRENATTSQINKLISEDDKKMESTAIVPLRKCSTSQGQLILVQNQPTASLTLIRCTKSDAASDVIMHIESTSEDGSMSPSKRGHGITQSAVENLNMDTIVVDEVLVDEDVKEGATTSHASNGENYIAEPEHQTSIDDEDEMKIDGSSEANHNEYMGVTVEYQKHETGDSNINITNLSSETTDLLRESSKSLSPEAVGQDHDQVSRLESNETELKEEQSVPYHNTFEITMEEKKVEEITMEDKEEKSETETNHQAHVESFENNNDTKSGKMQAKRSRVRLPQLLPFKPFLLQSSFKRISKRGKHRRV